MNKKINPNLQLGTAELEEVTSHRKKRNALMRRESAMPTTGGKTYPPMTITVNNPYLIIIGQHPT